MDELPGILWAYRTIIFFLSIHERNNDTNGSEIAKPQEKRL